MASRIDFAGFYSRRDGASFVIIMTAVPETALFQSAPKFRKTCRKLMDFHRFGAAGFEYRKSGGVGN
jgi:hypothetical protein